ncbi:hypothetical protein KAR91_46505 [Candidatus Pacearchaeota archaeon]|nr:hypothetical protein [Candidatus Pacearchaeota archaeon]
MNDNAKMPAECSKEAKHSILLNVIHSVRELKNSVHTLHGDLGAKSKPQPEKGKLQEVASLNTIVDVIDDLPGMVREECNTAHMLLNEIRESLI